MIVMNISKFWLIWAFLNYKAYWLNLISVRHVLYLNLGICIRRSSSVCADIHMLYWPSASNQILLSNEKLHVMTYRNTYTNFSMDLILSVYVVFRPIWNLGAFTWDQIWPKNFDYYFWTNWQNTHRAHFPKIRYARTYRSLIYSNPFIKHI